jgi:hypothetical protein
MTEPAGISDVTAVNTEKGKANAMKSFEKFPPYLHHKIFRFEMKFSEIFPAVIYFATSNPLNLTSQSAQPKGPPYVASRRAAVRAKARFRVHLFRLEPSKK